VRGYLEDLAFIHDAGFRQYALGAAPGLQRILARHGITRGLVVDLGCGSGRWARVLSRAGYEVLGIDQSPAMIRLARKLAPRARFQVGSLWSVPLPPCDAVTSLGECLNYCFDPQAGGRALLPLFQRIYRALEPGGILLCDFAGLDRRPQSGRTGRSWRARRLAGPTAWSATLLLIAWLAKNTVAVRKFTGSGSSRPLRSVIV